MSAIETISVTEVYNCTAFEACCNFMRACSKSLNEKVPETTQHVQDDRQDGQPRVRRDGDVSSRYYKHNGAGDEDAGHGGFPC